MNIRKFIPILVAVALIALGVGFLSLRYNDNYRIMSKSGNLININSRDGNVRIGPDGIEVKDGDDHVVIGWDGIKVNDGEDQVSIGWDGIKVKEGRKPGFSIGGWKWNWFGISSRDTKWETIDEEKQADTNGVNNISISSSFIDIKVRSEDREDVRVHYYGEMKTNVVPELKINKISNKLNIKLENKRNSYSVVESDVVLEVFVPKSYNGEINTESSSGDIYMKDLVGKYFNIISSSGRQVLENLKADKLNLSASSGSILLRDSVGEVESQTSSGSQIFEDVEASILDITASSGDIKVEESKGELRISTSSGRVSLDNESVSGDIRISTSSGDVAITLSDQASYNIRGSSSSGRYHSTVNMNIEENEKGRFRATIGSGEKSIDITTSSGDVRFSR